MKSTLLKNVNLVSILLQQLLIYRPKMKTQDNFINVHALHS